MIDIIELIKPFPYITKSDAFLKFLVKKYNEAATVINSIVSSQEWLEYHAIVEKTEAGDMVATVLNADDSNFLKTINGDTLVWTKFSNTQYSFRCNSLFRPNNVIVQVTPWGAGLTDILLTYANITSINSGMIKFQGTPTSWTKFYISIKQRKVSGTAPPLYNCEPVSAETNEDGDVILITFARKLLPTQYTLDASAFSVLPSNTVTTVEVDSTDNKILRIGLDIPYAAEDHISISFDASSDIISYQYVPCAAFTDFPVTNARPA